MANKGATAKRAPKAAAPARKVRASGGSFVGLDMGTSKIKIVEVSGAGTGLRVTGLALEDTPPGVVSQGVVADPKQVGQAIKAALARNGIRAKKCVVSVGGAAAMVVRVVDVPKMSAGELAETMKWQIEQYVPFPANDVELSYQKIDDPVADADPNAQMEVLLAVAQREMVSRHIDTLAAAGLTPVAVDVEPLAAGRALINLSREGYDQRNVVVVNIGATLTDVGIFKSGVLRFPRTIPLGGDNFTRAIADRLGIGMDSAEEDKRQVAAVLMDLVAAAAEVDVFGSPSEAADNGVSSPWDVDTNVPLPPSLFGDAPVAEPAESADANPFADPFAAPATPPMEPEPVAIEPVAEVESPYTPQERDIFQAILPVLGEFAMELRRSVDYFRSKFPMDTVDHVLLCGGGASLRNLDQYVQSELGVPTTVADPFATINVQSKNLTPAQRLEVGPSFAVALGLASRDALLGS